MAAGNRPEDIPLIINYYFKKYASEFNDNLLKILNKSTMNKLVEYHWPGNIRELQNVLQRILLLNADENEIDEIILNGYSRPLSQDTVPKIDLSLKGYNVDPKTRKIPLKKIKKKVFAKIEKEVITYVMEKTNWNRTKAADMLDISYKLLLSRIRELDIDPDSEYKDGQYKYLKSVEGVTKAFSFNDRLTFNYDGEAVSAVIAEG